MSKESHPSRERKNLFKNTLSSILVGGALILPGEAKNPVPPQSEVPPPAAYHRQDSEIHLKSDIGMVVKIHLQTVHKLEYEEYLSNIEKALIAQEQAVEQDEDSFSYDPIWDVLAQCESSGNWQAISPNGLYFGGLQFDIQTWLEYGGGEFAPRADLATKQQQIEVAERVRSARGGFGAWPVCGQGLG